MAGLGHIAVGAAAARWLTRGEGGAARARVTAGLAVLAMLPDIDVIGFALGVPYGAPFGHRGASHSLSVALLTGACAGFLLSRGGARPWARALPLAIAVALSHGLLDAMTDGGLGVALLWPFTAARFFLPWNPIPVAPIGAGMFSARGLHVTVVEALEFAPLLVYALWPARASGAPAVGGR